MARRKSKIVDTVKTGALMAGGAIAANKVKSLIPIENTMVKNAAPVVAGVLLSGQKGALADVGAGMMAAGLANLIGGFVPGLAGGQDFSEVYNEVLNGTHDSGAIVSPLNGGEGYAE